MADEELFKDFEKYKKPVQKDQKIRKMDEKEIEIHFKIKPLMLERAAYWLAIIVLIILVAFNPIATMVRCDCNETKSDTVQVGGAEISNVENTPEETTTEEVVEEEVPEETTTEEVVKQTVKLSGKLTMIITSMTIERDEDNDPKKITEIKFSIDNQKKDFRPKIKAYWYDSSDMDPVKDLLRAEVTFATLDAGTGKDFKITKFTSSYITDYHDGETLYIKVYDAETNELMIEKSKAIE
ncbi:MAG: hypothetical protein ABIJ08_00910 [Nanoarchaeota archaeon]